jgi:hypothetical protein
MPRRELMAKLNRCPLRDRQPHTTQRPGILSAAAVKHIEQQIEKKGYIPLPYLGIANHFYRCKDCHAVWRAGSPFERVSEGSVCGIYDHSLIWKPYP